MIDLKKLEDNLDKALANETKESLANWLNVQRNMKNEKTIFEVLFEKEQNLDNSIEQSLTIPVVSGNYYWVKLMTDDKHEPAMAMNLLGVMNFKFFNGVEVPCDKVNDYSECNYC